MKRYLLALSTALALTACVSNPDRTPEEARIARIQRACLVDAGLRPIVDGLVSTPEDAAKVALARANIDPVCANPSGDVSENMATAFFGATGSILTIYTRLVNAQIAAGK